MDTNYQPLHLLQAPPLLPLNQSESRQQLSVAVLWDQTARYVLDTTNAALVAIELLDYELDLLSPLSQAITYRRDKGRSEIETLARCQRLNIWKKQHQTTLERFSFWRRAVLFGVEEEELTSSRRAELWTLAHEAMPQHPDAEWETQNPDAMLKAMIQSQYPAPA